MALAPSTGVWHPARPRVLQGISAALRGQADRATGTAVLVVLAVPVVLASRAGARLRGRSPGPRRL